MAKLTPEPYSTGGENKKKTLNFIRGAFNIRISYWAAVIIAYTYYKNE
jgi:hypothetical protein